MTGETGLIAGRFRVGGLLGSGGTASVFRAHDEVTGQTVAIKLLHPHLSSTDAVREAFLLEARRTAHVAHPRIVAVIDMGTFDEHGTPIVWIAQQLVKGVTLAEHLRTFGPVPVQDAAEIACDVLEALAAAHAGGLVHRDVSPTNVMIRVDDIGTHATLLDFGLADVDGETARGDDVVRSAVTETTAGVVGNAAFASPEQLSGRPVGPQGDLYQVGGLLYFALTGRPPFAGNDRAALVRLHLHAPPPVPSVAVRGIPAAMDQVVVRAMVKDPSGRFADAEAMRDAIRAAVPPIAVDDVAGSTRVIGAPTAAPSFDSPSCALPPVALEGSRVPSPRSVSERSAPAWGTVVTIIALLAAVAMAVPLVASAGRSVPLPPIEQAGATSAPPEPVAPSATPSDTPTSPSATSVIPALGTFAEARAALAAVGLGVGEVVERDSPSAAGTVLASDPPSGATVPRGSLVTVSVASGANIIPDVTGMDTATAVSTMSAAGFSPTVSTFPSDRPTGTVARLEPAAGTALPLGDAVSVFVSAGMSTPTTTRPTPTPTPSPTPSATASPTTSPR